MTPEHFVQLIDGSPVLDREQAKQLGHLLGEYPYFQAARALQLKSYYQHHNFSYHAALKKAAAHTADRSVLFDFITGDRFEQDHISVQIKKRMQRADSAHGDNDFDRAVRMKKSEADRVLDPDLFEKSIPISPQPEPQVEQDSDTTQEQVPSEKTASAEKAMTDLDKDQNRSFGEWLRATSSGLKKSSSQEDDPAPANSPKSREHEIIDKFIEKNPKIKPPSPGEKQNIPFRDYTADSHLMTETLARIYADQKNYDKAIQAYNILILKNPEKSGLFADRIREIENNKENRNQ